MAMLLFSSYEQKTGATTTAARRTRTVIFSLQNPVATLRLLVRRWLLLNRRLCTRCHI